jgi:hypothetical protein
LLGKRNGTLLEIHLADAGRRDAMVASRVQVAVAGLTCVMLSVPTIGSAQSSRYLDDQPSVVVECGPGQRAVMTQRYVSGTPQVVARCEGAARTVARRSTARSVERVPQRTKTKTALMIAGSAATGAGIGGALKGKKGALIGAAVGGGTASIYEAVKRR